MHVRRPYQHNATLSANAELDVVGIREHEQQPTNIIIKTQPNEKSSIEQAEESLYDQIKKKYS